MNDHLLWLDVETTGLNPANAKLLQVAGLVTDPTGQNVRSEFVRSVVYDDVDAIRDASDPFIREMHDKSGVWSSCKTEGVSLETIDSELFALLSDLGPRRSVRVAGNSVRLDLNFLEVYLPESYSMLHYRSLDVSALAFTLKNANKFTEDFPKKKNHDALGDVKESLEEYRWFLDLI